MARARIIWDVDDSELIRFRNILIKIRIILEQLDQDIVDSLDIPVLKNVKNQYLKRSKVVTVKDEIDGHSIAKYCIELKDFKDCLRLLDEVFLIMDENNLSSKDFQNIDIDNLVNNDFQYLMEKFCEDN